MGDSGMRGHGDSKRIQASDASSRGEFAGVVMLWNRADASLRVRKLSTERHGLDIRMTTVSGREVTA